MFHTDDWWPWALLTLVVAVLLHLGLTELRAQWDRHQRRQVALASRRGERQAERLLARQGFIIEAQQAVTTWPVVVDG